ncbi:histone H4 transcription factor [Folsomia candida]|uniref:histone H4 transcription factor n=1 Tax=Folsomia candida TaxID=158441 RepID=UPI000B8FE2A7|nr:histone H4 transcription factor [Folsomia candida]
MAKRRNSEMDNLEGVSATTVKQVKLEQREGGERQACFVGASGNVLVMDSSKSDEDEAYVLGGSQIETESRETTAVESRRLLESRPGLVVAGPTNPLMPKRVQMLKPKKFRDEPLTLQCEWQDCTFTTQVMDVFMDHVGAHVPSVEVVLREDFATMTVIFGCNWRHCPWTTDKTEDLQRHLFLHAYHTKLKCIGLNTSTRSNLNQCAADSSNRNILPDLSADLTCVWGSCCQIFTNIQLYYNHIGDHIDSTPRGKTVHGGIKCVWRGCACSFPNAVKLRDHMRSHTQEKLLACPTCGGLFANRTRFFDHCQRQQLNMEEEGFACDVCMKFFSTARLLRDHIRSHVNTYKCLKCEMSCSSPSALNLHMRYKHSDEKPYACQHCAYTCKSYNDLNRHTKIHGGLSYECDEEGCNFNCKSMSSLKTHWLKQHGDGKSKYACHVCEKMFLKGYYLTKHLTSIHKLQWPAGHSRFRYKLCDDGFYRLLTVRYESVEEQDPSS